MTASAVPRSGAPTSRPTSPDPDVEPRPDQAPAPPTGPQFALDIQALQIDGRPKAQWPGWPGWPPGSTPLAGIRAHVVAYAAAVERAGRLAAALIAPEYPAPRNPAPGPTPSGPTPSGHTPSGHTPSGYPDAGHPLARHTPTGQDTLPDAVCEHLTWDCRPAVRHLLLRYQTGEGRLIHHVLAPFLDSDFGDPAGQVVTSCWAEAGVPRVVTIYDLDPLEDPDRWLRSPARRARYQARADWVAASDLVVAVGERAAEQSVRLLGYPPSRIVTTDPAITTDPTITVPVAPTVAAEPLAYDRLVEQLVARMPPPRPTAVATNPEMPLKVALMGPLPPNGGGIGAYNAAVLDAFHVLQTGERRRLLLGRAGGRASALGHGPGQKDRLRQTGDTRVDVVSPPGSSLPEGVARIHPESFGTDVRPASYDHVVYTLGNSSGHLATVETALRHPGWLWLHETRLPALATTALEHLDDDEFATRMQWWLEQSYPGRAPIAAARAAGRSHLALAQAGIGLAAPLVSRSVGVLVNSSAARQFLLLDLPPLAWHPPIKVLPPGCPPIRPRAARAPAIPPIAVAFGVVSMSKRPDVLVDAAARAGCRLAFVGPCPPILAELIADRARALGTDEQVKVTGSVGDDEWWAWMDRATAAVQLREHSSGELSAAVLDALAAGVPVVTNLPSAADYPQGTVAFPRGGPGAPPDPATVAEALGGIFHDPAERDRLSRAGQDYAAANQMAGLAQALLDAITG